MGLFFNNLGSCSAIESIFFQMFNKITLVGIIAVFVTGLKLQKGTDREKCSDGRECKPHYEIKNITVLFL